MSDTGDSAGTASVRVPTFEFEVLDDGSACLRTGTEWVSNPDVAASETFRRVEARDRVLDRLEADGSTVPDCPVDETEWSLADVPPRVVSALVEEALPPFEPWIAPGWAITGLRSFVETNGQLQWRPDLSLDLGDLGRVALEVVGTSVFTVDWGDGTPAGTYRDAGGPWPRGR